VSWKWTFKKWLISAFLIAHLAALTIWNLHATLRARLSVVLDPYMNCTGLWQHWGMFAPDPAKETTTLEALVQDNHGTVRTFAFPKIAGRPVREAVLAYRSAKYTSVLGLKDSRMQREFAARHVVRTLNLPADAYPLTVQLQYEVWPSPEPGQSLNTVSIHGNRRVLESYSFPNLAEAMP
jgi:hypothetical protein